MYAKHDNAGHDAWNKDIDDKREANHRAKKGAGGGTNTPGTSTPASAVTPMMISSTKKLALSESLCTALCTQTGLSADVADRIWAEACRDSGNDEVQTHGRSVTWFIASVLFLEMLLVHMTLAIPSQIYTLYQFLSNTTAKLDRIYTATGDAILRDLMTWLHYLISSIISIMIIVGRELIFDVTIAPIYF